MTNWATFLGRSVLDPDLARQVYHTAMERVRSDDESYGLRRDLDAPHTPPEALVPLTVRPITEGDVPLILGTDGAALSGAALSGASLSAEEKWERARRRRLLETGAGTCYVAVTGGPDGTDVPCYLQWLFGHEDNDFLQHYFRRSFPLLDRGTALLEDAFTPTAFRGRRIMSAAMSRIAEQARTLGARYVITFVGVDNAASLKGCRRAGFEVYTERSQRWRMLRQSIAFRTVLPPAPPAPPGGTAPLQQK